MKIYYNPSCSKCRGTRALLTDRGYRPETIPYLEGGLGAADFRALFSTCDAPLSDFVRADEAALAEAGASVASPDSVFALLAETPSLLQRPVVVVGDRAVIARPPERAFELVPDTSISTRLCDADEILALRHAVLREGKPEDAARYDVDEAETTFHIGVFADGRAVCCLTIMDDPIDGERAWRLRGMATDPGFRRLGLGALAMEAARAELAKSAPRPLWCNARLVAVPFYEAAGWRIDSDLFDIPQVGPHHRMRIDPT